MSKKKLDPYGFLWDAWCVASVVGIWPRFIEPRVISTTKLNLPIANLPFDLKGFKILQFSDLHLNSHLSDRFLNKLVSKIKKLNPDIIVFTGDFLCYSKMQDQERLLNFLNRLKAPYGCYAILGNHDYEQCVSINRNGEYDILNKESTISPIKRGFGRLFSNIELKGEVTERAMKVPIHETLVSLLSKTPFKLLHNENEVVKVKDTGLNICGLGEYMLGKFLPEEAFNSYDERYHGIILSHNPDTARMLENYPGDIILSGHTHGGQVNLPWLWKKFTLLENMNFKSGLKKVGKKWLYVNRGIGSILRFRWFATPEITLITL